MFVKILTNINYHQSHRYGNITKRVGSLSNKVVESYTISAVFLFFVILYN